MPWTLRKGALRALREAKGWNRHQAAEKVGLSFMTIRRHEIEKLAPATLQEESIASYCAAYEVEKDAFVEWVEAGGRSPAAARPGEVGAVEDPAAPQLKTLTKRARSEIQTGAFDFLDVGGESLELVGNTVIREVMHGFAAYENRRYVVEGTIDETAAIAPKAMELAFAGSAGEGTRFRIGREVRQGLPVYVTVFAPNMAHAQHLNQCIRARRRVALVVRVFVKRAIDDWLGFFIFEKTPKPRAWCFVIEAILPPERIRA